MRSYGLEVQHGSREPHAVAAVALAEVGARGGIAAEYELNEARGVIMLRWHQTATLTKAEHDNLREAIGLRLAAELPLESEASE